MSRPTAKKPSEVTGKADWTVEAVSMPPMEPYAPVCVADWPSALPVEFNSVTRTCELTKLPAPAVIGAFQ